MIYSLCAHNCVLPIVTSLGNLTFAVQNDVLYAQSLNAEFVFTYSQTKMESLL